MTMLFFLNNKISGDKSDNFNTKNTQRVFFVILKLKLCCLYIIVCFAAYQFIDKELEMEISEGTSVEAVCHCGQVRLTIRCTWNSNIWIFKYP